jgi:hypothetical protein
MRGLVLALVPVVLVALAAPATAAGPVRATMTSSSPRPLADTPWRYTITVKVNGKPAPARARLQILLGQTVVGCWKDTAMVPCQGANSGTWISFKGKRTGVLRWPAQSVGVRLTFQVTIVAGGGTVRLRTPVTVQPV